MLQRILTIIGSLIRRIPGVKAYLKWYSNTPFGRYEPKTWTRPESEDEYQQELYWQGFISPDHWEDDDLTEHSAIMQDLSDLDEYLLPVFWEFNQAAKYYQRKYYYYQWVFIIGAFLTTVMGVLSTFFSGGDGPVQLMGNTYEEVYLLGWQPGLSMVTLFSGVTTIVSAITSYFTLLSNQGEPRKRWASYRRLAEELRMLYFKFLSRMEPYNKASRVEILRKRIIEIREQESSSA